MKPVYEKIEEIRQSKGVTKTHIARHCDRSVAWYSDVSSGNIQLKVTDMLKIADALCVDVRIFFDDELSGTLNKLEVC